MTIRYRDGLKYQLTEDAVFWLDFAPPKDIVTEYIQFYRTGKLVLKKSYAWDGPSGPTWDDETNLQGSACHDGGYQLMRLGLLDEAVYRPAFDTAFRRICEIDGMAEIRASLYFDGVHLFGAQYARRQVEKVHSAGKPINLNKSLKTKEVRP